MEEKIFIERNRNLKAVNKENKVNVNLTQKARLLPYNNITDTLNLHDLFIAERDACNKYRLIFTINPVCSNVLYNMKTEIVYKEGSPECQALIGEEENSGTSIVRAVLGPIVTNTVDPVTREQAIRDTEYSHPNIGGLVYHCGVDIFNNHMLRSTGFSHVNRMNRTSSDMCGTVFNTIEDFVRDGNGNMVIEVIGDTTKLTEGPVHLYRIDNILPMDAAFAKQVKNENGWYGFDNVGFMEIPNCADGTVSANKLMNNNKSCEFIDFYPDRSLFSFIPKLNKYRHRAEKNWEYCITYPYRSDYGKFNEMSGTEDLGINGIKCTHKKVTIGSGQDYFVFYSQIKHNLSYGDTVRMYNQSGVDKELFVIGLGDSAGQDKEHCFRVYENDLKSNLNFWDEENPGNIHWFKKLSNQTGCEYYFRVFKKLVDDEGDVPDSTINKLAYGENIYGDRMAQIIYTEDINLDGLRDNRGRPLSELYLTIVKTNKGHKLWYDNNIFNDSDIEFSHCFGEVTSGIETLAKERDYNVRKLTNVNLNELPDEYVTATEVVFGKNFTNPESLEKDITVDGYEEFLGDIVEFNPSTNRETVLEPVFYRFNTQQRETTNPAYLNIFEDEFMHDDYDEGVLYQDFSGQLYPGEDNYVIHSDVEITGFTVEKNVIKNNLSQKPDGHGLYNPDNPGQTKFPFPGNVCLEGYYYKAHYRIPIREISSSAQSQVGAVIEYDPDDANAYTLNISGGDGKQNFLDLTVHKDYRYIIGDLFGIYRETDNKVVWGVLDSFEYFDNEGDTDEVSIRLKLEISEEMSNAGFAGDHWELILTNGSVPAYASYIKKEQKFVWCDVLKPSEASPESGLDDVMFTNGAIYFHTNINFFLKRQDATGEFGLLAPIKGPDGQDVNPLRNYKRHGTIADFSQLIYLAIEAQNACM